MISETIKAFYRAALGLYLPLGRLQSKDVLVFWLNEAKWVAEYKNTQERRKNG